MRIFKAIARFYWRQCQQIERMTAKPPIVREPKRGKRVPAH